MPAILRTRRVCESRADVACSLRGSSNYIGGDGVEHRGSSGEGFPRAPPPPLPSPQAHAQTQTNLGTNVTPALSQRESAIAAHLNVSTLSTAKFGMPTGGVRNHGPSALKSTLASASCLLIQFENRPLDHVISINSSYWSLAAVLNKRFAVGLGCEFVGFIGNSPGKEGCFYKDKRSSLTARAPQWWPPSPHASGRAAGPGQPTTQCSDP